VDIVVLIDKKVCNLEKFIFMPAFSLEMVAGAAVLERLEIHHVQHNSSDSPAGSMTGPSKIRDVITPLCPWTTSGPLCLANLFWDIPGTWHNQSSWDLSIWRSGLTFRVL